MRQSPQARARSRRKQRQKLSEPGRAEWKRPRTGRCAVCGRRGLVFRHHVYYEQHVRAEGGDPWDQRNSLDVGAHCDCHERHHSAGKRIRLAVVQLCAPEAIEFGTELMGSKDKAAAYLTRRYD